MSAIGGAILVWQIQESSRSAHLARAIALQFGSLLAACYDLIVEIPNRNAERIGRDATFALRTVEECHQKLARFNQSLHLLPSDKIGMLIIPELLLVTIRAEIKRIKTEKRHEGN